MVALALIGTLATAAACSSTGSATPGSGDGSASTPHASTGTSGAASQTNRPGEKITIALQPGLAAEAHEFIAKQEGCVEKGLPSDTIVWKELASTAVIGSAMLSGDVQIGANGLVPFLVNWSKGFGAKIIYTGVAENIHVMVKDPKYKTMKDLLESGAKIAAPSPTAIQGLMVRFAAKSITGNLDAANSQIVSMDQPTAYQALLAGQVGAHVASPPFPAREAKDGARSIYDLKDALGSLMPVAMVAMSDWGEAHPDVLKVVANCLEDGRKLITSDLDKAAQLTAQGMGQADQESELKQQLDDPDLDFTYGAALKLGDLEKWADFEKQVGMIDKVPASLDEVMFKGAESLYN